MAEYNGSKTTSKLDAAVQDLINVSNAGGRVRTWTDSRSGTTAWAQNDTVFVARLPSVAVILPTSQIAHEALGSSVTMDIGVFNQEGRSDITDNDDALATGIDVSSGGRRDFFSGLDPALIGQPLWEIAGLTEDPGVAFDIKLTLKDANPTDDASIAWSIHYTID